MFRANAVFKAGDGLTPDLAAKLSRHAERYSAHLMLECGQKCIRLDSLIGILSMEMHRGMEIGVIADGEDEIPACEDIRRLLMNE